MTTTKDEALRVAREALTKARSCVDATVSKEHAAWAHELDAALRTIALAVEGPILSDEQVDRMLSIPIPGGSSARDWFLPHETPRGLANVRDVVRAMFAVAKQDRAEGGSGQEAGKC